MRSRWNQTLGATFFPAFERKTIVDTLHRDAVLNRANERTKIAANTMVFIHARDTFKRRNRIGAT